MVQMRPQTLLLGLDISTTGSKALLIDGKGQVIESATTPHTLLTPHALWAEEDPLEWWQATLASIHTVLEKQPEAARNLAAIGLTGQMHGLVAMDGEGKPLRPAILWNDQRTAAECDEIRLRLGGREQLIQTTGNDALTGFTAPKILWTRNHEPELYAQIQHILLPKDYVRYQLTGAYAVDKADGSGTLLFDLAARDWSNKMLDLLDIPSSWLPPTFEGTDITGYVSEEAAALTGLPVGLPVVAGGGDQSAQAAGVGAVRPEVVAVTLGTSGVVFATTQAPLTAPHGELHAFCHAVPQRWHLMGVMLSAAGSLQWYHDTFAPTESFEALLAEAAEAPPGSDGLLFLPYLSGERTPHPDPLARGAFIGLTLRHRRAHLTRAVLEGVAFGLRDSFTLLHEISTTSITDVRISGGGSKSPLWRQILADVLDVTLTPTTTDEGAAYGAALLAGVGTGLWPDVETACSTIAVGEPIIPNPKTQATYEYLYKEYRALYPALQQSFARLSASEQGVS